MSNKKTPVTFNAKDENLKKIKFIAEKEARSTSNLLEHICKLHIEQYENKNGVINIDE